MSTKFGDGRTRVLPALKATVSIYDEEIEEVVDRREEPTGFAREVSALSNRRIQAEDVLGMLERGDRLQRAGEEYRDVLIFHASEDKEAVVEPLQAALEAAGISCWVDSDQILWGDSTVGRVNEGMKNSRYRIVSEGFHNLFSFLIIKSSYIGLLPIGN